MIRSPTPQSTRSTAWLSGPDQRPSHQSVYEAWPVYEARIDALVLVSSGYASKIDLPASDRRRRLFAVLAEQDSSSRDALAGSLLQQWEVLHGEDAPFDPKVWSAIVGDWLEEGYNPRCPHVKLGPEVFGVDRAERLSRLVVPALVLHGTDDPMFPIEHARALVKTIPEAELEVRPGRGHELFADREIHQLIASHLVSWQSDRMTIDGITHLSLSVVDLERSRRFYVDVLGLSVLVEPFSRDGYDEVILQVPGRGRIGLCLQAHQDNDCSSFDPSHTGLDHLAFAVPTLGELHEWAAHLDQAGVDHSGVVPNRGFGHLINLRDLDDIQVELHTLE